MNAELISARQAVDAYCPWGTEMYPIYRTDLFFQLDQELKDGDILTAAVPLDTYEFDPEWFGDEDKRWVWVDDENEDENEDEEEEPWYEDYRYESIFSVATAHFVFDSMSSVSSSFKTSKYGYIANAPVKVVYLGKWMGSLTTHASEQFKIADIQPESLVKDSSKLSLAFSEAPVFSVYNQKTGRKVLQGKATLIQDPESVYAPSAMEYPQEHLYALDISELTECGWYFVSVEGVGRSLPFQIHPAQPGAFTGMPSHAFFLNEAMHTVPRSASAPVAEQPWWTDLWTSNPMTAPDKLIPCKVETDIQGISSDSNSENADSTAVSGEWTNPIWSYNPSDPQLVSWKNLPEIPNDPVEPSGNENADVLGIPDTKTVPQASSPQAGFQNNDGLFPSLD